MLHMVSNLSTVRAIVERRVHGHSQCLKVARFSTVIGDYHYAHATSVAQRLPLGLSRRTAVATSPDLPRRASVESSSESRSTPSKNVARRSRTFSRSFTLAMQVGEL